MGIPVKLEVFEGPLDLLLHLIDKNKIDIYDIPIVEITNQYMEYIRGMQKEDLNVMSEFLVKPFLFLPNKYAVLFLPVPAVDMHNNNLRLVKQTQIDRVCPKSFAHDDRMFFFRKR